VQRRRKTDQGWDEPSPQNLEIYRHAWHSYVTRRNLLLVLFLSFILVGVLIAKLKLGEPADLAILLGWIGVYLAGGWWLTEWRCPRCGKIFGNRLWTQRCIGCELSKDEVAAAARGK
jgi:xanthosine utilization system XapX-like protein